MRYFIGMDMKNNLGIKITLFLNVIAVVTILAGATSFDPCNGVNGICDDFGGMGEVSYWTNAGFLCVFLSFTVWNIFLLNRRVHQHRPAA